MKYRIYIDEVGNPDVEGSDDPNHRFLSLTGVILELGYVACELQPEMEHIKRSFFHSHPDEPVVLHRKELVNARPPFEALLDDTVRASFDRELLALLGNWDYTVISVCLDKREHRERYTRWRYDPYHYCLAVLLERYTFFLNRCDALGDVMAESSRLLKNASCPDYPTGRAVGPIGGSLGRKAQVLDEKHDFRALEGRHRTFAKNGHPAAPAGFFSSLLGVERRTSVLRLRSIGYGNRGLNTWNRASSRTP